MSSLPTLADTHKPAPKIAVAIARELAGFLWAALQPAPAPANVTTRDDRRRVNETMTRVGDGPRRRRMIRGTIARIGELAMRYGHPSQLATLDCTSSRRSTVMCALPRATAVTTEYQRDSSSKRPRSSVVSAARAPTRRRDVRGGHGLQGFAPCGRRLRRPWTPRPPSDENALMPSKLTLAGDCQATIATIGA